MKRKPLDPHEYARFKFGVIAPLIQDLNSEASEIAYCRRVTQGKFLLPNGELREFKPDTIARWARSYRKDGYDALVSTTRSDKGKSRALSEQAIDQIYILKAEYPRLSATGIYRKLIEDGFLDATTNVRTVQRFIELNDLKTAKNPLLRDRKAFEEAEFGRLWQCDTCYLPYITENGASRRTFLVMIIDDCTRMIVGGALFYNDNAYNFQKVLKNAILAYGIPDKIYLDNGSPYANDQLSRILVSVGIVELHTAVRDGASKGKVERNFRTVKERWVYANHFEDFHSLEEANASLYEYIRRYNLTVHSSLGKTPLDRFYETRDHIRIPKSEEWLDECFLNRIDRKVRKDSCVTINGVGYDVPPQFIDMTVEIRYLPGRMDEGYILYQGERYPIIRTDKVANARAKRNNKYPALQY